MALDWRTYQPVVDQQALASGAVMVRLRCGHHKLQGARAETPRRVRCRMCEKRVNRGPGR